MANLLREGSAVSPPLWIMLIVVPGAWIVGTLVARTVDSAAAEARSSLQ
jgi:hypothetical protein